MRINKLLIVSALTLLLITAPVSAQEDSLPEAGNTPAGPFYFVEQIFEGVGTFFTFGDSAKAERYLLLAEERLAEAKVLADEGDERAQKAVNLYEKQIEKAKQRNESDLDFTARVTDATTKHITALDDVLEQVPEEARAAIEAAKGRSMTGQIEALRGIATQDPERAVEIFDRAAEGRLQAAGARADRGDEDADEALEEYSQYAEFGQEIATLGEGLQSGDITVEELVERATARHNEILADVQTRVPEEAQEGIERSINAADVPEQPTEQRGPAAAPQNEQQEEATPASATEATVPTDGQNHNPSQPDDADAGAPTDAGDNGSAGEPAASEQDADAAESSDGSDEGDAARGGVSNYR